MKKKKQETKYTLKGEFNYIAGKKGVTKEGNEAGTEERGNKKMRNWGKLPLISSQSTTLSLPLQARWSSEHPQHCPASW